jgi:hypothetical protein
MSAAIACRRPNYARKPRRMIAARLHFVDDETDASAYSYLTLRTPGRTRVCVTFRPDRRPDRRQL